MARFVNFGGTWIERDSVRVIGEYGYDEATYLYLSGRESMVILMVPVKTVLATLDPPASSRSNDEPYPVMTLERLHTLRMRSRTLHMANEFEEVIDEMAAAINILLLTEKP